VKYIRAVVDSLLDLPLIDKRVKTREKVEIAEILQRAGAALPPQLVQFIGRSPLLGNEFSDGMENIFDRRGSKSTSLHPTLRMFLN
jgi:hypothetical protein